MKIRSFTNPETLYQVRNGCDGWYCTCPDHFYRGRECKHIRRAKSKAEYDYAWSNAIRIRIAFYDALWKKEAA